MELKPPGLASFALPMRRAAQARKPMPERAHPC